MLFIDKDKLPVILREFRILLFKLFRSVFIRIVLIGTIPGNFLMQDLIQQIFIGLIHAVELGAFISVHHIHVV